MGCLILLLFVVGLLTFPFGLIFWALAAIICIMERSQQNQTAATREKIRHDRAMLEATNPEAYTALLKKEREAKAKRWKRTGWTAAVALPCMILVMLASRCEQSTPGVTQATPTLTRIVKTTPTALTSPAIANATPTPSQPVPHPTLEVRRAEPVRQESLSTPTPATSSSILSSDQATAA
jgi:hypothetical protein